ncbi:hypothetical protein GCM10027037_03490 [Mucilaginibacter koreensis]
MKKILTLAVLAASFTSCKNENLNKETTYTVNETSSKAEWKGSARDHYHVGSFKVTGELTTSAKGTVTDGYFLIPIASIEDYDLPEPTRQVLLEDLKSENFFSLAMHPNAGFHITKVEPYTQVDTAAVAGANYLITGDFRMVGQTHSMSFPAKITATADSLTTEAKFKLDRTKWGMNIYTDPTKQLYIYPEVNIHLTVKSAKKN